MEENIILYIYECDKNIQNKAKTHIPKALKLMKDPAQNIQVFYYSDKYKRKGYATYFFGQILHKIINDEDAFIYLVDSTGGVIGKKFYGGSFLISLCEIKNYSVPKVVAKFNVLLYI